MDQGFLNVGPISSPSDKEATWLIPDPEDVAIPHLSIYYDGFGCHLCSHVSRVRKSMVTHYSKSHRNESEKSLSKQMRKQVQVQALTSGGATRALFEVNRGRQLTVEDSTFTRNSVELTLPINDAVTRFRQELHAQIKQ